MRDGGESFYMMGRVSPPCHICSSLLDTTERGNPLRHVCLTYLMRWGGETLPVMSVWAYWTRRRGETLSVASVWLIQRDEEGRPSLSCLFDLFNATRRGDPPCHVCLTYSMRRGGSPLPVVYGFYLTRRGGKPSPSRLFDLIRCNEEGLPSLSHLFHISQCGKGGKPSCYVFH